MQAFINFTMNGKYSVYVSVPSSAEALNHIEIIFFEDF